jgi:Family of unknown function (DUF5681)
MSDDKTPDDYEVGYGKPPKNTQFRKGVSGNPRGRPKKAPDFDHELIREANSVMTVTENGRKKRISKLQGIAKLVTNRAITGSNQAIETFFKLYLPAVERVVLAAGSQSDNSWKHRDVNDMSDEELLWIANGGSQKAKRESEKGHISSKE